MSPEPETEKDLVANDRDLTREELGQTVEELAHKLDVPGRAADKAQEVKDTVVTSAQQAKDRAAETAAVAADRARTTARTAATKTQETATAARDKAVAATPEPVARGGRGALDFVRANPVPVAAGIVGGVVLWQIVRKRGTR